MTMTNELNLSALFNLPSQLEDSAALRHPEAVFTGSYVTTASDLPPRLADGTYVTTSGRFVRADQSRGHYVTANVAPTAIVGTYVTR